MFKIKSDIAADAVMSEPQVGGYYTGYSVSIGKTFDPATRAPITRARAQALGLPTTFEMATPSRSATYAGNDTFYDDDKSTRYGGQDPRVDMAQYDFLMLTRSPLPGTGG